jgi:hypothetical protein
MVLKSLAATVVLGALLVAPASVFAQDTTQTQTTTIWTTMPMPEQGYGSTIYNAIPVSDQPNFVTWITGFPPDERIVVIRALHGYTLGGPTVETFTTDTTPTMAMPVFVNVLSPSDQTTFTTDWNNMTPDQQSQFITYARDLNSMPASSYTTTTTVTQSTETSGAAAQPFGTTMAIAFSTTLAAAVQPAYMGMANTMPTSELGGMNNWLSTLTPDQQALCIRALAPLNEMGMKGATAKAGMSDYNVHNLLLKQLDPGDKAAFDSMWSSMNDQQLSTLQQLARDAYNGGLNDLGASAAGH